MIMRFVLAFCAVITFASGVRAVPVELQSYRAVYRLDLAHAKQSSGIAGLNGLLVLQWGEVCDGYGLKQRMGYRIARVDSLEIVNDIFVDTLESKDGTVMRYDVQTKVNGKLVEAFKGRAKLKAPGKRGTATFSKPRPITVDLPPGTLFPTEYTKDLIERAMAGDRRVVRTVFEGSNGDKLYKAIAFIGEVIEPGGDDGRHELLVGLRAWPVQIAYFALGVGGEVPEYEVGIRLFANGVGDKVRLHYGEFIVGGELTRLENLPASGC